MYKAKKNGKGRIEHEIVAGPQASGEDQRRTLGRATAHVLGHRQARVRPEGQEIAEAKFATIQEISAQGISVHLDCKFPKSTLLIVEPLSSAKASLLARVARVTSDDNGWKHTCELATALGNEDLSFGARPVEDLSQPGDLKDVVKSGKPIVIYAPPFRISTSRVGPSRWANHCSAVSMAQKRPPFSCFADPFHDNFGTCDPGRRPDRRARQSRTSLAQESMPAASLARSCIRGLEGCSNVTTSRMSMSSLKPANSGRDQVSR